MKEKKLNKKKKEQGIAPPAEIIVPLPKGEVKEQSTEYSPPSQTSNIPHQTENMEVHKHPHHVMHKKKWPEYLLEFLMIFLAVFLGFIAENIRESNVDHKHEKQYAQELYNEFFADSIVFNSKLNMRLDKEKNCDYLYSYIKDSSLSDLPKAFYPAYTKVFFLINSYTFEPKDGILNQLKSTGSLRYFKNPELQKLFGDISVAINNVRYRSDQEYQFFANPIKPFLVQHYDFKWLDNVRKMSANAVLIDLLNLYLNSDTLIKANILDTSAFIRSEAMNLIMFYKTMILSTRTLQLNDYMQANKKILQVLRKEYHLQ